MVTRPLRRLTLLLATFIVAVVSCGREPTAPYGGGARIARGLAFNPVFPPAFQQAASGGSSIVPFDRVRVLFLRTDGTTALDTVVFFPPGTDSVALSLAVPLSPDAPASGEPLNLYLGYINAKGDTVFRGGPLAIIARPAQAGQPAPEPVTVPVSYTGPGASARSVRIASRSLAVLAGDNF